MAVGLSHPLPSEIELITSVRPQGLVNLGSTLNHFIYWLKKVTTNNFRKDDVTSNILSLSIVNRTLVNKVITCEASNTDLSLPLHISLQLDLVLAPVEVMISSPANTVILGQELTLTCTVVGARPIPNIVWEGDYKTALEVQYKVRLK